MGISGARGRVMKLKLKNTEDGLRVASAFIGAEYILEEEFLVSSKLTGFCDEGFHYQAFWEGENSVYESNGIADDEITIDLETSQPCIYACMKQGFRVEITFEADCLDKETWDFSGDLEYIGDTLMSEIKSIKILDLDRLNGVELID